MRSIEEIQGVLQTWPEGFKNSFGRTITKDELLAYLKELEKKRMDESIRGQFGTYSAPELKMMITYIEQNKIPNVEGTTNAKKSKGS